MKHHAPFSFYIDVFCVSILFLLDCTDGRFVRIVMLLDKSFQLEFYYFYLIRDDWLVIFIIRCSSFIHGNYGLYYCLSVANIIQPPIFDIA